MYQTDLARVCLSKDDLATLEAQWRAFAARADASFFQDWTWVGCAARDRYRDPVLLRCFRDGELFGMALLDRRSSRQGRETLVLHESTDPRHASPFIEHNGPLLLSQDSVLRQAVLAQMLSHAMRAPIGDAPKRLRRVTLSGVDPDCAAAARLTGGVVSETAVRVAPYVDFRAFGGEAAFLEHTSRNTRHQIRRSNRSYATDGAVTLQRAETVAAGHEYLDDLIRYHEATWRARGKPGAFASEHSKQFYRSLIETGVPRGEVDLLRVTAGATVVGYLMNFRHRGRVSAYQSGFNYGSASQHRKPGMTCHYLAIEHYRAMGLEIYDFLAGGDRYKLSLANAQRSLHWLSVAPTWHPHALGELARRMLRTGEPKEE